MSINKRVSDIIRHKGLKPFQFANICGIHPPTLSALISRDSAIKSTTIQLILKQCTDISAEWLLMGTGEMLKEKSAAKITELKERVVDNVSKAEKPDCEYLVSLMRSLYERERDRVSELERQIGELHQIVAQREEIITKQNAELQQFGRANTNVG